MKGFFKRLTKKTEDKRAFTENSSVYQLEDLNRMEFGTSSSNLFQLDLLSIVAEGFAAIAEYKDHDTGNHIKRVAKFCEMLAEELRKNPKYTGTINDEWIEILKISAPLHDIGKVTIPDAILTKPGKLTEEEFEIMKLHASAGASILFNMHQKIACYDINYFEMAAVIAHDHHEKYDGSGYPRGLIGDEIPLEAQLTSLADVFDALMSKRPYKKAFSVAESFEIILRDRGKHFNPDIVDSLVQIKPEILKMYRMLADEDEVIVRV